MPHNTTYISSHVSQTLHQLSSPQTASMRMTSRPLRCIAKALLTILSIRRRIRRAEKHAFHGKERDFKLFPGTVRKCQLVSMDD
jgi:hypothetical protein